MIYRPDIFTTLGMLMDKKKIRDSSGGYVFDDLRIKHSNSGTKLRASKVWIVESKGCCNYRYL